MFLIVVALACMWYAWRFETSVPIVVALVCGMLGGLKQVWLVALACMWYARFAQLGGLKQVFLIVVALACLWYAWRFETSVPYSCCPGLYVVCLEV